MMAKVNYTVLFLSIATIATAAGCSSSRTTAAEYAHPRAVYFSPTAPDYDYYEGTSGQNRCIKDSTCKISGCLNSTCAAQVIEIDGDPEFCNTRGMTSEPLPYLAHCGCLNEQCQWYYEDDYDRSCETDGDCHGLGPPPSGIHEKTVWVCQDKKCHFGWPKADSGSGGSGSDSGLGGNGVAGGAGGQGGQGGVGGASDASGASGQGGTAGIDNRLVLDPATLIFFDLPINSVRYAVAGHDPVARACVSIIWDYSNTGHLGDERTLQCDKNEPGFPYVIIENDTDGPCNAWNYGANVSVKSARGCVQFVAVQYVDVEVTVTGDVFTGAICASNQ
jgi:hypothetical protein